MAKAKRHNFFLFIRKWRTGAFSESSARLESSMNDQSMLCAFVLIVSACTINTFRLIDFSYVIFVIWHLCFFRIDVYSQNPRKLKKKTGNVNDPVWFPSDSCPLLYRFTMDPSWSETGDRYLLKLFRDYLFHQVTENGAPWVDLAHIVACLNKVSSFGNDDGVCGNLKVLSPRSN